MQTAVIWVTDRDDWNVGSQITQKTETDRNGSSSRTMGTETRQRWKQIRVTEKTDTWASFFSDVHMHMWNENLVSLVGCRKIGNVTLAR